MRTQCIPMGTSSTLLRGEERSLPPSPLLRRERNQALFLQSSSRCQSQAAPYYREGRDYQETGTPRCADTAYRNARLKEERVPANCPHPGGQEIRGGQRERSDGKGRKDFRCALCLHQLPQGTQTVCMVDMNKERNKMCNAL